jgi:hypothetical protein
VEVLTIDTVLEEGALEVEEVMVEDKRVVELELGVEELVVVVVVEAEVVDVGVLALDMMPVKEDVLDVVLTVVLGGLVELPGPHTASAVIGHTPTPMTPVPSDCQIQ